MPNYTYKCEDCESVVEHNRKVDERNEERECEECGGILKRGLSRIMEPTVMEKVDSHRNVRWRKDQDQRVRKRAKDYFIENEMPDLIAKHGKDHAKRSGWVKPDGKVVTKEDLK